MIDLFPLASMQLLADMAKTGLTIQPKESHGKNKLYICNGLKNYLLSSYLTFLPSLLQPSFMGLK
jgi:hypothetical protein